MNALPQNLLKDGSLVKYASLALFTTELKKRHIVLV